MHNRLQRSKRGLIRGVQQAPSRRHGLQDLDGRGGHVPGCTQIPAPPRQGSSTFPCHPSRVPRGPASLSLSLHAPGLLGLDCKCLLRHTDRVSPWCKCHAAACYVHIVGLTSLDTSPDRGSLFFIFLVQGLQMSLFCPPLQADVPPAASLFRRPSPRRSRILLSQSRDLVRNFPQSIGLVA